MQTVVTNIHAFTNCMTLHCLDLWDLPAHALSIIYFLPWCVCFQWSQWKVTASEVSLPNIFFPVWALSDLCSRFIVLHFSECSKEIQGRSSHQSLSSNVCSVALVGPPVPSSINNCENISAIGLLSLTLCCATFKVSVKKYSFSRMWLWCYWL